MSQARSTNASSGSASMIPLAGQATALRHTLANELTLVFGVMELILEHPALPADLRDLALSGRLHLEAALEMIGELA